MTCFEAAREYLALGLHPIPCVPRSKRPLVEWKKYQDTRPLPDEVDQWWTEHPDANVALVLGRGVFAVDLDGGKAAETLLTSRGIWLPAAPRNKTANGSHVFLAAPGPVPDRVGLLSANGGKPQVDIKGVGIVVVPPSTHPSGTRYEWVVPLTLPLPEAPQVLLDLIRTPTGPPLGQQAPSSGTSWVIEALRGVPEGQRDNACTRLAGYFLGRGLDPATVEVMLVESFARNCTPRFSHAGVRKCVQSVSRRHGVSGDEDRTLAPVHLSDALDDLVASVTSGPVAAVRTPSPALNEFLNGGFAAGELVYLGARPGIGKTALGLEFARGAAKAGTSVLLVSREMVNLAISRRLVAQEGRVSATALKTGRLGEGERTLMQSAVKRLKGLPIWLTDEAVSLAEITDMVLGFSGSPPLGLLIVDYLQLVRAPRNIQDRRLQVEAVSQGLKTLAVQFRIPVVCLSSLSRPVDRRNKRPLLESLRESGELEHDADIVLLLHREPMKPETECVVAKNRDGRQGTAHLIFRHDFVAFDEAAGRDPVQADTHAETELDG